MRECTWDDVEAAFCVDGTELHFTPHGPDDPTVAVLRHDIGTSQEFEVYGYTVGDGPRGVRAFLEQVAGTTGVLTDGQMAELAGADPDDPDMVAGYGDEIAELRRVCETWHDTATTMLGATAPLQ